MDAEGTVLIKEQFTSITCRNKWLCREWANGENSLSDGGLQSKSQSLVFGVKADPCSVELVEELLSLTPSRCRESDCLARAPWPKAADKTPHQSPGETAGLVTREETKHNCLQWGKVTRDFCNLCWDLLFNRPVNDLDKELGSKVRTFSDDSKYSGEQGTLHSPGRS